jgi:hypothetical protein
MGKESRIGFALRVDQFRIDQERQSRLWIMEQSDQTLQFGYSQRRVWSVVT